MKYLSINNFISKELCENLIKDADNFTNESNFFKVHGNRNILSCSNLKFNELSNKSDSWKRLTNKLHSKEFFDECCKNLGLDSNRFCLKKFFKLETPTDNQKVYKKISETKVNLIPNKSLLKFLIYRFFKDLYRKIRFSKFFFHKKSPLEVLYDYSKAGNGYNREIHRDSDNRLVVFVLYLNTLPPEASGGTLDLYKLIKKDYNLSQPKLDSCELIKKVSPDVGKLFIFLNSDDSYHGVSLIKNSTDERHFIYGAYTLLSQKNEYIKNSSQLKTEFHLYD